MNFKMTLRMALKSIVSNKMRTLLTMLGIIIGVASVIIMVSIGEGTSAEIKSKIEGMGSNILNVRLRSEARRYVMDYDEIKTLENVDAVSLVAPVVTGSVKAKNGVETMSLSINGIDDAYMDVNNYEMANGRNIVPLDVDYREKVAVVGKDIVDELFAGKDPVGSYLQLNGTKFLVVGVLKEKGSTMGKSSDEVIFIPITTATRLLKLSNIQNITIQATSSETVTKAEESLTTFFMNKMDNDDTLFRIFNQTETLETIDSVTKSTSLMLGGIAAISLMVGGIGIMNIMLVSVMERTREIGVRKALGAKTSNIMTQFLVESAVVSGLGGIIGITGSYLTMYILRKYFSMSVVTPSYIVIAAFSFSLIVGIFFGLYPASKASKLKPVDALRYE